MKKVKLTAVLTAFVMILSVCVLMLSPTAAALNEKGSITLNIEDSKTKKPLSGSEFRLYHIADAYETVGGISFRYVSPYHRNGMKLSDLQDSSLPLHLTYFAKAKALPFTEKKADKNGKIVFDELECGAYLVVPSQKISGYYMLSPFIITVPQYSEKNDGWEYEINATPKIGDEGESKPETYISVQKKWETDSAHPSEITVVLLCDLEEYDRVVLNEGNNWYHRWDNLPGNHVWNVVEINVPDGFIVQYKTSSNTVTIINKSDKGEESTTNPGTGEPGTGEPGTGEPGTGEPGTGEPGTGTTEPGTGSSGEGTTAPDKLVQTGQLNWPVPILAVAGLLLFSIGWAVLNFGKRETE